ncbi:MAG: hypothetical protein DDT31_01450 [Syntrophomonadaceae bacterium]|nr:hypothetical protein [Bacillota bacterium]
MNRIHITIQVKEDILDDALISFPNECCGFLFGRDKKGERFINRQRRFEISPLDYLKAEQFALDNHLELLGVYHSHPNHPSIPSEHDRISAQAFFSYVIIAVRESSFVSLQSWQLNEEFIFEEEPLLLVEESLL